MKVELGLAKSSCGSLLSSQVPKKALLAVPAGEL
jgi:hypothetical protein